MNNTLATLYQFDLKTYFTYVIKIVVFFIIAYNIYYFLKNFQKSLTFSLGIWKRFSLKLVLISFLIFIGTLFISGVLMNVPFLDKGWSHLVFETGGNIMFSFINLRSSALMTALVSIFFITALLVVMPELVYLEETLFRKEKLSPKQRIVASINFGLIHCITGIPIAAGIALIFTGYCYSLVYLKTYKKELSSKNDTSPEGIEKAHEAALLSSTSQHLMTNTVILLILVTYIILRIEK